MKSSDTFAVFHDARNSGYQLTPLATAAKMDTHNFPAAMPGPARSKSIRAPIHIARPVFVLITLVLLPAAVVSQIIGVAPMHGDHRAILISGFARGAMEGASIISIAINGIDFVVNTMPSSGNAHHEIGSPMGTCSALQDQIAGFTLGIKAIPEFEAACLALAGEAALLLVQANTNKYVIPSEQESENEAEKWVKDKRRFVFVSVNSTDRSQKAVVVK